MEWLERLSRALDDGPRQAAALLTLAGAGLAGWSVLASVGRGHDQQAILYLAITIGLVALAGALLAAWRPADVVGAVILFGCIPGTIGAAIELATGVDAGKAAEVRSLGADPRTAVELNLVYFVVADLIAGWLVLRLRRGG